MHRLDKIARWMEAHKWNDREPYSEKHPEKHQRSRFRVEGLGLRIDEGLN